jgi:hypothetical protein
MTDQTETLKIGLVLRFSPAIYDLRGNQHQTQQDADRANEIYRLQDQLSELRAVPAPSLSESPPIPSRRRGRRPELDRAEAMACEILHKNNNIAYVDAARRAVDACFPHENEARKGGGSTPCGAVWLIAPRRANYAHIRTFKDTTLIRSLFRVAPWRCITGATL